MPWRWPWTRTHDRALFNIGDVPTVQSWSGETVTPDRALRHAAVWACVRLLADTVSTLPLHVYRDDERDPLPTPRLLQRPSADHPVLSNWLWSVMGALLTTGNCWGMITDRIGAGAAAAQVDLLEDGRVSVQEDRDAPAVIRVDGQEIDRAELWHVVAYPRAGSILGMSPIQYAKESVGLGLAVQRYGGQFFGDGATPQGVLSTEQQIGEEAAEALSARWEKRHGRRRRIAVLGNGAKFQPVTIPNDQAQFLDTAKLNAAQIAAIYGVPAGMMAGVELAGHQDYSSPEQRAIDFLTFGLRPWLVRVENAVSTLLPRNQRARFNAGGMVRATLLDRYQAHKLGIEAGWLLPSEVRALEDRPPIPGIDERARPTGGGAVA